METCLSASATPGRSKFVESSETTRGDSLWVKGISEPRVRDIRVRDTVFSFVVIVVSYRVMQPHALSGSWLLSDMTYWFWKSRGFNFRLMVSMLEISFFLGLFCFCLFLHHSVFGKLLLRTGLLSAFATWTCGNDQCRSKDLCVLTSVALPSNSLSSPMHAPFTPSTSGSQVPGVDSVCSPLHQVRGGVSLSRGNASKTWSSLP